ncbi:hypothetical protein A2971_02680 [Candidatus Gottesmanbacteria bacterium RIFCSPLOWO2_01_FULL_46_21]|uniref:Glycosyltransferase RgtA/B/C/D-like domain-containing protein n=1 Tax=Candidatus Gottesmanbacteria bacterium RIFCSPLOWO2_01_FULL_46_21 TaxID=1798393 RepID=A0A1F6AW14_9BACT|nr:MAG: hypothetical protein A2971_02680 [Candidatus Gottesmanbacteria bacterium RIFCSPLOWO2_01_FULL_46_21]
MKLPKYSNNWFYFALTAVFALSVVLRLWHIDWPIADWHSWRQSDTASVARNFIKFGFDPLRPRFDDLSNIPSGLDNPMGWRMVEFPLYQLVSARLFAIFSGISIEIWLRLVTVFVSSLTGLMLGLMFGIPAALLYAVLPYGIYYGRSILPDPFMVFWAVMAVYLLFRESRYGWVFSAICAAIALLVKPFAVFLLLPVIYLFLKRFSFIRLFVYSIISLLPLFLWRRWISQFPEGIAAFTWLFNSNGIRFKGAWFHWLFAERLGNLILGYWGLIPFGLGVAKNKEWISRLWLIGALFYLIIVATGNVQHDYYQILLLPVIAVYTAKGFAYLLRQSLVLAFVSFVFMLAFSWFTIRTYYWINHPEIVEAGREADKILPPDAKVIASYNGDTTFLYQTNRQGWPIGFEIDKKIKMGATHYVTISPTDNDGETKDLASRYTVLVRNDTYAIIDLTRPKQ